MLPVHNHIMKTSLVVAGLLACVLFSGCANSHEGSMRIGPTVWGGITYYPVKPGTTYYYTPVDYTTNPPPAGSVDYVTVVTTNRIDIHMIDGPGLGGTGSPGK